MSLGLGKVSLSAGVVFPMGSVSDQNEGVRYVEMDGVLRGFHKRTAVVECTRRLGLNLNVEPPG